MKKSTKKGVFITQSGTLVLAGYVELDDEVPDLRTTTVDVVDCEDGSGACLVLAAPEEIPRLDAAALEELRLGEPRRIAFSKLSEEDRKVLGVKP